MQAARIAGLSVLQLYLVAAALRRRQHGHDTSNFAQASLLSLLLCMHAMGDDSAAAVVQPAGIAVRYTAR